MFGYVTIYRKGLADADMDRYQAYYCGLCRALDRRYGRTGQLALSYDMAFVAILLTALYDVPTAYTAGRCAPHPIKPRPRADNEFMDYAADMTAALAYYNFMDDWQDDHRFLKTAFDTSIFTDYARFEVQFGNVKRPTARNTTVEQAKFEVLNHKYTDLSESRYGAALLNDCKYGISVESVLKQNPGLSPSNFSIGKVIRIIPEQNNERVQKNNGPKTFLYTVKKKETLYSICLLYTSDAADEL